MDSGQSFEDVEASVFSLKYKTSETSQSPQVCVSQISLNLERKVPGIASIEVVWIFSGM